MALLKRNTTTAQLIIEAVLILAIGIPVAVCFFTR